MDLATTDLATMTDQELDKAVRKVFGHALPWDRKGSLCLVHVDGAAEARRKARVERFTAADLFDPTCPHCVRLLERGAFVALDGFGATALCPRPDGRIEMVMKRPDPVRERRPPRPAN